MSSTTRLDDSEIQRRALQAAAKVALTMSVASVFGACGGTMSSETPHAAQDDAGLDTSAAEVGTVSADAGTDTATVVPDAVIDATACGPIAPDAATPDQLDCCAAKVKDSFATDWTESDETISESHPELADCCNEIVEAYDGTHELGLTFQQARACCSARPPPGSARGGGACPRGGPPMPPPMPRPMPEDEAVS